MVWPTGGNDALESPIRLSSWQYCLSSSFLPSSEIIGPGSWGVGGLTPESVRPPAQRGSLTSCLIARTLSVPAGAPAERAPRWEPLEGGSALDSPRRRPCHRPPTHPIKSSTAIASWLCGHLRSWSRWAVCTCFCRSQSLCSGSATSCYRTVSVCS